MYLQWKKKTKQKTVGHYGLQLWERQKWNKHVENIKMAKFEAPDIKE